MRVIPIIPQTLGRSRAEASWTTKIDKSPRCKRAKMLPPRILDTTMLLQYATVTATTYYRYQPELASASRTGRSYFSQRKDEVTFCEWLRAWD